MESISSFIAFLQPGRREDVTHAAEAKWCVVIVVSIQVLIVDIVVHLRVTGSSKER
jgi:hypothetical protein